MSEKEMLVILVNSLQGGNQRRVNEILEDCLIKGQGDFFKNVLEMMRHNIVGNDAVKERVDMAIGKLSN